MYSRSTCLPIQKESWMRAGGINQTNKCPSKMCLEADRKKLLQGVGRGMQCNTTVTVRSSLAGPGPPALRWGETPKPRRKPTPPSPPHSTATHSTATHCTEHRAPSTDHRAQRHRAAARKYELHQRRPRRGAHGGRVRHPVPRLPHRLYRRRVREEDRGDQEEGPLVSVTPGGFRSGVWFQ